MVRQVVRPEFPQVVRQVVRPEFPQVVRPEFPQVARPEVRHVRPEVRPDFLGHCRRVVRSIHCSSPVHPGLHQRPTAVRSAPRLPMEHPTRWVR